LTAATHDSDPVVRVRIGELSRRVGVTVHRLRAWETRYRLLRPQRSAGGFRLYSPDDEQRVRAMLGHLVAGMSAAEAARIVSASGPAPRPSRMSATLGEAFARFDEPTADAVLDAVLGAEDFDSALRDVVFPVLRQIGDGWECGTVDIAEEHFASNLIERRLTAVRASAAPCFGRAVLACPSGEHHVLGLAGLGAGLRRRGVCVTFLGADTPISMIDRTARAVHADAVVVAATMAHVVAAVTGDLRALGENHRVVLAGPAATDVIARRTGLHCINADPVTAAARMADLIAGDEPVAAGN
jgi:DNA-binding transcriptional MerR regulator